MGVKAAQKIVVNLKVVEANEKQHQEPVKNLSRRNMPTLTSALTAGSKAACGLTNKLKAWNVDIDAGDANNELAAVEYVEGLYSFYKEAEKENLPCDYMLSQPDINEKMRAILVDWMIHVHDMFDLMPETLYLAINIIDRFLLVTAVPRRELQLLGMGALFTASKYEEIWASKTNDWLCVSDISYSHEQVLAMEKMILGKLEWTLTVPTWRSKIGEYGVLPGRAGDDELCNAHVLPLHGAGVGSVRSTMHPWLDSTLEQHT